MADFKPCVHCGGSGRLRYENRHERRVDPRVPRVVGEPYPCNFCNGSGRDDYPPPPWPTDEKP